MSTGNEDGMRPGTGRIVRQTGPSSVAEVAIGLELPIAMKQGPDGGLYVAMPAYGNNDLAGVILRVVPGGDDPIAVDLESLAGARCRGAPSYAPPEIPAPVAATPAATSEPTADGKDLTGAVAVSIVDFTYVPGSVEITAGTTVIWTNNDSVPHTVTAPDGSFDSGNLSPGESWSFTFREPGDFAYACLYHPQMQGSVTVS
jgi:plastocyanin